MSYENVCSIKIFKETSIIGRLDIVKPLRIEKCMRIL